MTSHQRPAGATLQLGQRVRRTKPDTDGTVVEVSRQIKVKWDNGAVSYYSLHQSHFITRLSEAAERP